MDEESASSQTSVIPLALAVLAIFIGGAGLYFGFNASQRLSALEEAGSVSAGATAEVSKAVDKLDTRVRELAAGTDEIRSSVKRSSVYRNQTEQGLKKVVEEVNANREQILKNAKSINELAAGGARPVPAPTAAAASGDGGGPAPAPGQGRTYRIQPGDTFAKVAAREGVSLQALLDANPAADPYRLAIGQEIVIPSD